MISEKKRQKQLFFVDDIGLLQNNLVFIRDMASRNVAIIPLSDVAYEWLKRQNVSCVNFRDYEYSNIYKDIVHTGEQLARTWYLSTLDNKDYSLCDGISAGFLLEWTMAFYFIDMLKVFAIIKRIIEEETPEKIFVFEGQLNTIVPLADIWTIGSIVKFLANGIPVENIKPNFIKAHNSSFLIDSAREIFSYINSFLNLMNIWFFKSANRGRKKIVFFEAFRHIKTVLPQLKSNSVTVVHLEKKISPKIYLDVRLSSVVVDDLKRYKKKRRHLADYTIDINEFENNTIGHFVFRGINIYPIVRDKIIYFFKKYIPAAVRSDMLCFKNYINKNSPHCIITENDSVYYERMLVVIAKNEGIKTIVVQHGTMIETRDGFDEILFDVGFYPLVADKFLAYGEFAKNWFEKRGIPADRIILTGAPRYDIYYQKHPEIYYERLKHKLIQGRNRLVLVVLSEHLERNYIPICQYSIFEAKCLVQEIIKIANTMRDVFFVIRPRAKNTFNIDLLRAELNKAVTNNICIDAYTESNTILRMTDVCVGAFSSLLTEAMIFNIPVITYNISNKISSHNWLSQHANSYEELTELLHKLVDKNMHFREDVIQRIKDNVSFLNYGDDGKSAERVAEYILKLTSIQNRGIS